MIKFKGLISSSKSLINRILLLETSFKGLKSNWISAANDVVLLKKALDSIDEKVIDVGEGGTTFRFLAVYLSSLKGEWTLIAKPQLLERPHEDLYTFFDEQKIQYIILEDRLILKSNGWTKERLVVSTNKTTQVLTAVVLVAVGQKKDFDLEVVGRQSSEYFSLTLNLLKDLGLNIQFDESKLSFKYESELNKEYEVEGDWSSAAFLYVLAAFNGEVEIENLKENSFQPDSVILEILNNSGVEVLNHKVLSKNKSQYFSQKINLKKHPDLFPVLAAFSAFCSGEAVLYGAPQLAFKESDRISEVYNLLGLCGYKVSKREDGITIFGQGLSVLDHEEFDFDCSNDHRIFMCAYVLKFMGYRINIIGKESINKSFPDFFDIEDKYVFSNRS